MALATLQGLPNSQVSLKQLEIHAARSPNRRDHPGPWACSSAFKFRGILRLPRLVGHRILTRCRSSPGWWASAGDPSWRQIFHEPIHTAGGPKRASRRTISTSYGRTSRREPRRLCHLVSMLSAAVSRHPAYHFRTQAPSPVLLDAAGLSFALGSVPAAPIRLISPPLPPSRRGRPPKDATLPRVRRRPHTGRPGKSAPGRTSRPRPGASRLRTQPPGPTA